MGQPDKEVLVRKKVLYIGSAVPMETADGLEGIQKPLLERYPSALNGEDAAVEGIEAYVSVLPSGITLRYLSDMGRVFFFPISSLTLCAAVRCIVTVNQATGEKTPRFVSLNSPSAGGANSNRPAIFTTITRRTEGRKVLECHGFICYTSRDALELVQVTSYADRLSKGKINGAAPPPVVSTLPTEGHTPIATPRGVETNTLRSNGASTPSISTMAAPPVANADGEHPVRLVAGHVVAHSEGSGGGVEGGRQRVAPEFYEPPPRHGYFYKTPDTQIKMYTVERVTDGKSERLRAISPNAPGNVTARSAPGGERRSVHAVPHPQAPAAAGNMTLPYPPGRPLIPVRAVQPPAGMIRPRFFSPPPPLLRPRPMMMPQMPVMAGRDPYVFLPPPPHVIDAPYVIKRNPPARRGGSGSSSDGGSSRSSSGSRGPEVNGRRVVNGDGGGGGGEGGAGEGSSDGSCRPRTPPTDYERGPRVSRKEQFDRSQRYLREVNGGPPPGFAYATLPGGAVGPHHPYDFYMYPPPHHRFFMPPYMMERARSVPAPFHRGKSPDRGGGKKSHQRKAKKDKKKKASKRHQRHPHNYGDRSDISTDSVGYASEVLPGSDYPRMPRDFRRFENQFKHERAFSKSLAEEGVRGGAAGADNAYSLNEHMAQRGAAPDTEGFTLY